MVWGSPQLLQLLWGLPFLGWLMWLAGRSRRAALASFADPVMAARITPSARASRGFFKGALWLAGVGFLVVAAARPRFGVYYEEVSAEGVDLFVCLDVSRSMLARDVAPSRLERAKSDVLDLLEKLQGDRVGLIAFAGKPVRVCPLTSDHGFFKSVLAEVSPLSAPRGGSLIGDAIREALADLPRDARRDQAIILITDGEDQDSMPLDAAELAVKAGVKIFTVGLGDSKEGGRIPVQNERGETVYLKTDGQVLWSKLDEKLLKEIAMRSGGAYVPAGTNAYDLGRIYEQHLAGLTAGKYDTEKRRRYRERFQVFLLLGLAFLGVNLLIPEVPRPRRRGKKR